MMMTAELNSCWRSRIRSRICACTVTSSAVVGSSAISRCGVARQRHRDHRALPHAAGELMRIVVDARGRLRDADAVEQLDGVLPRLLLAHVVVNPVGLDDLVADRVERVHRRQRILEDHRHLLAAQVAHPIAAGLHQILTVEPHLAGDVHGARRVQPHDRQAGHALARARFADDAEGLAALDREREPVDTLHDAVVGRKVHLEITDVEKRFSVGRRPAGLTGGARCGRGHRVRTLGSTTAYSRSTIRFATMMNVAPRIVTPSTFGRSLVFRPIRAYCPMPGSE